LQTHRHDDVSGIVVVEFLNKRTAVGVGQNQTNLIGSHHAQHIQQIADVETDFQRRTAVLDGDFLFGFFLLGVVGLNLQKPVLQLQTDTAVLLVGKNGGPTEGFTKQLSISHHQLVSAARQYPLVIGKFSVHQLGGEGEVASVGANMVLAQHDADVAVLFSEQTGKLQDAFARNDDLMTIELFDARFHRAHRQAVTIGRDRTQ